MPGIGVILWDIGGVLLTNGWDHSARLLASRKFDIEWDEFEQRHQQLEPLWDTGRIDINEYLEKAIFFRTRPFSPDQMRDYIVSCSQPHRETLDLAGELFRSGRYLQAALNNEPLELNLIRIEKFGLRRCFTAFFSSCFLGVAKPDAEIFRRTLLILQRPATECLFIDDRAVNVESAARLGMNTLHFTGFADLRDSLQNLGVYPLRKTGLP